MSGRPNRMVSAEPPAAYRTATANSGWLIDHRTPENAATVTAALLSIRTNERGVVLTARRNCDQVSRVMGSRCSVIAKQRRLGRRLGRAGSGQRGSPDQPDLRRKRLDGGLGAREPRAGLAVHHDRAQRRLAGRLNDDS